MRAGRLPERTEHNGYSEPSERAATLLAAGIVLLFVGVNAVHLGTLPEAHEDEPWIAEPGYRFVTTGRFASELFRGLAGHEHHAFGFMPLFSIWSGLFLRLFGLGLFQARLAALACGAAALVGTFLLGRRLLSARHGLVAVALLAFAPVAAMAPSRPIGIPLADLARLARYDVAVPALATFALAFLAPVLRGAARRPAPSAALAGFFAGFATLAHVYGAATVGAAALSIALVPRDGRRRLLAALTGAFLFALLPWLVALASAPADVAAQQAVHASRFDLGSAGFYASNVRHEAERWGPVLRRLASLGPTAWGFALFSAAGLALLVRRAARTRDAAGVALSSALLGGGAAFALFVAPKTFAYAAFFWPFLALAFAVGLLVLVDRVPRLGSALAAAVALAALVEAGRSYGALHEAARRTTPYADVSHRLAKAMPAGVRLLAQHDWWFGLERHVGHYRSILATFGPTDGPDGRRERPFAEAVALWPPDYVLIEPRMARFLGSSRAPDAPFAARAADVRRFLADRASLVEAFDEPPYGGFELYRVDPAPR